MSVFFCGEGGACFNGIFCSECDEGDRPKKSSVSLDVTPAIGVVILRCYIWGCPFVETAKLLLT